MVIHDRGYKRWDGDREASVAGATVIFGRGVQTSMANLFKRKFFAQLLSFWAYGPSLFALGFMYLLFMFSANTEQWGNEFRDMSNSEVMRMVTPSPDTVWGYLLNIQAPIALLLCVLVGSGLIAEDRRTNALEMYLSRPLSVGQYVLGKLLVMGFFLSLVTIFPAIVLITAQILLGGMQSGRTHELLELMWRMVLAGGLAVTFLSLVALTASSLANRARNAAILLFGFGVALEGIVANILRENFRDPALNLVSLAWNLGQVSAWILGNDLELEPQVPTLHAALVLGGFSAFCLFLIRRRVRPVEVVA